VGREIVYKTIHSTLFRTHGLWQQCNYLQQRVWEFFGQNIQIIMFYQQLSLNTLSQIGVTLGSGAQAVD
jgi:hypothetical protein